MNRARATKALIAAQGHAAAQSMDAAIELGAAAGLPMGVLTRMKVASLRKDTEP